MSGPFRDLLPSHWQFVFQISRRSERHRKNQRVDANRLSKPKPDRKIRIKHYRVGAAIAAHGLSLDDPPTWISRVKQLKVSCCALVGRAHLSTVVLAETVCILEQV